MKVKDIRSMTKEEIADKLIEFQDKLFKQKIQKSLGQADNLYKIRHTKKDIAKMKTVIRERESKELVEGDVDEKAKGDSV